MQAKSREACNNLENMEKPLSSNESAVAIAHSRLLRTLSSVPIDAELNYHC